MALLPIKQFHRCVERYGGEHKVKSFSCMDQFLTLAFAQLTYRESLRDIEACLRGSIPRYIHISGARTSDVSVLDHLPLQPGAIYVMDRGYIHFKRLYALAQAAVFFVVRTRSNMKFRRRYSRPVDTSTGLRSDQTIVLTGADSADDYPAPARRIHFFDEEHGRHLVFLTNHFGPPALVVAQLYKSRWKVELFFDGSTLCTPLDVMEFQGPIALN
jgi:hypothetical protein